MRSRKIYGTGLQDFVQRHQKKYFFRHKFCLSASRGMLQPVTYLEELNTWRITPERACGHIRKSLDVVRLWSYRNGIAIPLTIVCAVCLAPVRFSPRPANLSTQLKSKQNFPTVTKPSLMKLHSNQEHQNSGLSLTTANC